MWLLYRVMRKILVCFWFYFVPFMALALNFMVPYEAARSVPPPSTMDAGYLEFVEQILNEERLRDGTDPDYIEPSVPELVAMMEAVPMPTDDCTRAPRPRRRYRPALATQRHRYIYIYI